MAVPIGRALSAAPPALAMTSWRLATPCARRASSSGAPRVCPYVSISRTPPAQLAYPRCSAPVTISARMDPWRKSGAIDEALLPAPHPQRPHASTCAMSSRSAARRIAAIVAGASSPNRSSYAIPPSDHNPPVGANLAHSRSYSLYVRRNSVHRRRRKGGRFEKGLDISDRLRIRTSAPNRAPDAAVGNLRIRVFDHLETALRSAPGLSVSSSARRALKGLNGALASPRIWPPVICI